MDRLVVVLTTVPNESRGAEIAKVLVSERLAACVNIVPAIRSVYRWKGQVEDDSEALMIAKVTKDGFERYRERLLELHPYEIAEVVALDAAAVNQAYLDWVVSSLT